VIKGRNNVKENGPCDFVNATSNSVSCFKAASPSTIHVAIELTFRIRSILAARTFEWPKADFPDAGIRHSRRFFVSFISAIWQLWQGFLNPVA
jgi:hypothetical protein